MGKLMKHGLDKQIVKTQNLVVNIGTSPFWRPMIICAPQRYWVQYSDFLMEGQDGNGTECTLVKFILGIFKTPAKH